VVVALVGVQVMTHLNRSFTGIFALLRTMLPPLLRQQRWMAGGAGSPPSKADGMCDV
jgi:hypothetical protein